MDKAELQDKVCTILADQLAVDRDKVTPDARFSEDLDADSLDLVEADPDGRDRADARHDHAPATAVGSHALAPTFVATRSTA